MGGQRGFGGGVRQIVADVGEEGAAGLDASDVVERGLDGGVGRMMAVAERVDEQDVQIAEQIEGGFGNLAVIGEVGEVADAVPVNGLRAVQHRNGLDTQADGLKRLPLMVEDIDFRDEGLVVGLLEDVGKDALEGSEGFRGAEDRDAGALVTCRGCGNTVLQKAMVPVLVAQTADTDATGDPVSMAYLCIPCARLQIALPTGPAAPTG